MKTTTHALFFLALLLVCRANQSPTTTVPVPDVRKGVVANYAKTPLHFEANQGQTEARVKFLARGPDYGLFLTPTEAVLVLQNQSGERSAPTADAAQQLWPRRPAGIGPAKTAPSAKPNAQPPAVLRLRLVGGDPLLITSGQEPLPGKVNYFKGNESSKWRSNVPTFAKVKYDEVYPGIDLVFYGNQRQLEFDFVVAPGADPNQIQLSFEGADKLELADNGDLVLHLGEAQIRQHKPNVYQLEDGQRKALAGQYRIARPADQSPSQATVRASVVTFEIAAYDRAKPLVIDPVIVFSTYLGGSVPTLPFGDEEAALSLAVDNAGCVFLTGYTRCADFPTQDPYQASTTTEGTAFVTKLSADGSTLVYSTYLADTAGTLGTGIAVDASGSAYVVGSFHTFEFPHTANAFAHTAIGAPQVFLTKFSPDGSALLYSTDLGEFRVGGNPKVAVDNNGNAYVFASVIPPLDGFPATAGAFQTSFGGVCDAFVAKIDTTKSGSESLVYATFLGGSNYDIAKNIALDSTGRVYLLGQTGSLDFPLVNPIQPSFGGEVTYAYGDVFVAKLNPTGSALDYSTYLGGAGDDDGQGIALDSAGNIYLTGGTTSPNFPTKNAYRSTYAGETDQYSRGDVFVAKLNAAGSDLVYSTYLGGANYDIGYGIGADSLGRVSVSGQTYSFSFPEVFVGGPDPGGPRGFVLQLDAQGLPTDDLVSLSGYTDPVALVLDGEGNTYVAGYTRGSVNIGTPGAFQTQPHGSYDAFVAKIAPGQPPAKTTPDDLGTSPPNFVIEAEDYDFQGGQTLAVASIMPYTGGAYSGLAAVLNVDYYNADPNDSDVYRPDTAPNNVDMYNNLGGRWGTRRPGYDVVVNYSIGWVNEGDWQNYTRDIPAGTYAAWAALSFAGTADRQLWGRLSKVTSGVGTPSQTWEDLGTFDAAGSGGWGANDLVPMKGSDGTPAAFAHPGGPVTLRFWLGSGDFDWFVLTPAVVEPPPTISSLTPSSAVAGSGAFTLVVDGAGFTPDSVVSWNGEARTTHFAASWQLSADIPATDLLSAEIIATASVTVVNPGGLVSNPATFTITGNSVNDAPVGTDQTITINEDTSYTFAAADFGFSDPNDSPANAFLAVKITTLPAAGTLTANGVGVNPGDFVSPHPIPGVTWTARESNRNWYSVASSADGTKLVAAVKGGQIYTSTDSGVTWTARASNRSWNSVASSADGTKLVAVVYSGQIYTSTDSGATWTARASNRGWWSVASSADGTKLVALAFNGSIYTSADSGVTWTARATSQRWYSVASSSDGTKLVAVVDVAQIYTSTDSGVNWTARETNRNWVSVASSADGTKLVAVTFVTGQIHTSTDSGANWTVRMTDTNRNWFSVASSADGTKLAAVQLGGQIYTSTDSGITWTARESNRPWQSIACSADGAQLVAGVSDGQIYTSSAVAELVFTPAANANGSPYTTFTFQVQDDGGTANGGVDLDQTPNTMTIDVTTVNDPPVAAAGVDQSVDEATLVTLDGSGSSDPEGDGLTFQWMQMAGPPVSLDLANPVHPTFVAPLVGVGGATLVFELTVSDGSASAAGTVSVAVQDTPFLACTVVTTLNDSGPGSLREAINCANANPGTDTIAFNIPGVGVQTIQPQSPLPRITDPVIIDGYTQPGARRNGMAQGNDAVLLIELDGSKVGELRWVDWNADWFTVLWVEGGSATICGLVINRFPNNGILIVGGTGHKVQGNFIGTDPQGTTASATESWNDQMGGWFGVCLSLATDCLIGGTDPSERNVISGNQNGIVTDGTLRAVIQGNYVGTDATGTYAIGNTGAEGIRVDGNSDQTLIGGTVPGAGNLISGNNGRQDLTWGWGIGVVPSRNTTIQGNFIGTDKTGTIALPNNTGIREDQSPGTVIGGTETGAGNLISGNRMTGVLCGSVGTTVQGNLIGTDVTGTAALGNSGGIGIHHPDVLVGGTEPGTRNIISGNTNFGVSFGSYGTPLRGSRLEGNFIGTDITGTRGLGQQDRGIALYGGGRELDFEGVIIGGSKSNAGNLISGNLVAIDLRASGVVVQGNFIGTDAAGTVALGNSIGVFLADTASGNLVGGTVPGAGNVISGHTIPTAGSPTAIIMSGPGVTGTRVQGNLIGTDITGTLSLGNGSGLMIVSASDSIIGGIESGAGNVIARNDGNGVWVTGAEALRNTIRGNSIFDNGILVAPWFLGIDLGNEWAVTPNDLGDADAGPNNLQNYPVITAVSALAGSTKIEGTLKSTPNTTFTLDFYANTTADPSGHGEGEIYLGAGTVTTDANGHAAFAITVPAATTPGQVITATATDPDGNTSEFSGYDPVHLVSATANCALGLVRLEFDQPLDEQIASDPSHYALSDGLAVLSAQVVPNSRWVELSTSEALTEGVTYTATVNGLVDILGNPIVPDSQVSFQCDASAPHLVSAAADCLSSVVSIEFDEVMDGVQTHTPTNYALSGGLTVLAVNSPGDGQHFILTISGPTIPAVSYTLTVNNVLDAVGNPIAPDSQVSFQCVAKTTPDDLGTSPPCFVIEVEDYDFGGGQTLPVATIMPYTGGAYAGLAPVWNVDYYNDNANNLNLYRPDSEPNNVDLIDNLSGRWGTRRPGYDVVVSYRIGWVFGADWQNYTREIPAGTYAVWTAVSSASTADHQLRGRLSKVTSGVGTENQTWEDLGTFDAPGTGAWGANDLVPMKGSDGAPASFAHGGGPVTLRFWLGSGDFDWFVLAPVAPPPAAILSSLSPAVVLANGLDFELIINGSGFVIGCVVQLDGQARVTTFVSSSEVRAQILAADIASGTDLATRALTALNPGSGASNPLALTVASQSVGTAQSGIAASGQTVTVSTPPTAPGEAGVAAALENTGGGSASVTAATYSTNPTTGTIFDVGGGFVDVQVTGADAADSASASFYYPSTITGVTEENLILFYFTGTVWAPVVSSGGGAPAKDTNDNLDGTVSGGRFTVLFDNTSAPMITELSGTVFTVSLLDTTPPAVWCPPPITAPTSQNCEALVPDIRPQVVATENCTPAQQLVIVQEPLPGTPAPLGITPITVTVADTSGNSRTCTTVFTVEDRTPPAIVCPADMSLPATGPDGAPVTFTVAAEDNCSGVSVVCSPASGSVFPLGATTVTCTATDAAGNSSTCSFTVTVTGQELSELAPAQVWIGLKNSDDVGTKFDLLAEVFKNGSLIGSGQLDSVPGGSSGFNNAVLRTINMALPAHAVFVPGDSLSFRLSVRIAVNVAGHRSGTARLWFNDAAANSQFGATVDGVVNRYFLLNGFSLGSSAGSGPKKTIDVFVDKAVGGNPFKPFGTWSRTF